ncbi:MAG: TniQ family protein [Chloroflexi bacterium]|nr:TniQ family protein [Chloroflexota bacterium]
MSLQLPSMAPRTRLYHLEPLGVGTPMVEGLTGYVMRLAEAHCVSTSALVAGELLPAMRPYGLGGRPAANWLGNHGPHFNGTGDTAREAVEALTRLTGRPDLVTLTMRPWSEVLAPHGLLRLGKHPRVWCSLCHAGALEGGTPLYEQLLWSIAAVLVCPQHRRRLSERCPYDDCARALPSIAALARPGHCSWCKRVLSRRADRWAAASERTEETGWDLWVAEQIGALLAMTPSLSPVLSQADGVSALDAFVRARCGSRPGADDLFAQAVGVHANQIWRWRKGRTLPTIGLLLRVCHALGVSLTELLLSDTSALNEEVHPVVMVTRQRKPRLAPASYHPDRLRQGVETLVADDASPPLSVAETARRLGCTSAVLSRLCPDVYQTIADRYQAYRAQRREERLQQLTADIRRVMAQLDSAEIYPASKRVRPLLQRRVHPRNSDYNRIHHQLLPQFGWNVGGTRVTDDQQSQSNRICSSSLHGGI